MTASIERYLPDLRRLTLACAATLRWDHFRDELSAIDSEGVTRIPNQCPNTHRLGLNAWAALLGIIGDHDTRDLPPARRLSLAAPIIEALQFAMQERHRPMTRKVEAQKLLHAARSAAMGRFGVDWTHVDKMIWSASPYLLVRLARIADVIEKRTTDSDIDFEHWGWLRLESARLLERVSCIGCAREEGDASFRAQLSDLIKALEILVDTVHGSAKDEIDHVVATCRVSFPVFSSAPWFKEDPIGDADPRRSGVDFVRDVGRAFDINLLPSKGLHRMKLAWA